MDIKPQTLTLTEEVFALMISGKYRREKRYMDTWAKWMAVLGLAILLGGGCALGWGLIDMLAQGLVATP